jgi:hypothetical protein
LAFWLPRIPLSQGSLYGTILAEVYLFNDLRYC